MSTHPSATSVHRGIRWVPGALLFALTAAPLCAQTPAPPTTPPPETVASAEAPTETPSEAAPEKKRPRPRLRLGPDASVFLPSSSRTRDRYGDAWWGIGLGVGSVRQVGLLGAVSGEVFVIHRDSDTGEAYIVPVGIAYRRSLTGATGVRPYAGGAVDLVLADFHSPLDNVGWGLRAGAGLSALAGSTFGEKGYLEARYMLVTRMVGLDFSGVRLTAGIRF